MAKYYIMAVGGSGALAVESLVHLCAAGIVGANELNIVTIDPDQTNENVQRLQQTILNYKQVRSEMKQKYSTYYQTKVEYL